MKQFQDLVTLAPWTFIFQICNLLILTAGVKHFLFKPVQQILAKRKVRSKRPTPRLKRPRATHRQ